MRLFVAITLNDEIRAALAEMQARLTATDAEVRWVAPENFHLTVKFLGDLTDDRLADVEAVCAELAVQADDFRFAVRGASAFPKRGPQMKTLWAGVGGGDGANNGASGWKTLVQCGEPLFAPLGTAREGGLVPHITLGRVKSGKNQDALRAALEAERDTRCGAQQASKITLIQSFLEPDGAVYRKVNEWSLRPMRHDAATS